MGNIQQRLEKGNGKVEFRSDCEEIKSSIPIIDVAERHGIQLEFIKPGKPTQNSYIERFNRTYRDEVLDMYVFSRLSEVREITGNWIKEYNEERPHESLGNMTPAEYMKENQPGTSTLLRY